VPAPSSKGMSRNRNRVNPGREQPHGRLAVHRAAERVVVRRLGRRVAQ
jgi:hypothetical protein